MTDGAGVLVPPDRDGIPTTLRNRDTWVCWRVEIRDGNPTKVPVDPATGARAKSNDPATWTDFATAWNYHDKQGTDTAGMGFMFAAGGPFVGVDLDDCRDPDSGNLDEWARDVLDALDTYAEVSPSGTGVHALAEGTLPDGGNRKDGIEMYDSGRFFTVTGAHITGTPTTIRLCEDALTTVHAEYIRDNTACDQEHSRSVDITDFDRTDGTGSTTTFTNEYGAELKTIRERDPKLDALLTHIEPAYSLPNDDDSPSGYDLAAASKLWYWRFSPSQIATILRRYRDREKVRERDDYLSRTIESAIGGERVESPTPTPDGGDTTASPSHAVKDAWNEHADIITDADMPVERLEAARPVFEAMAKADLTDADVDVEVWIEQLRAIDDTVTKPKIREWYEIVREEVREDLSGHTIEESTPLDTWLEEHVEHVVVYSSPDTHADAEYHWHLDDGRKFATSGDTHFRWQELRKEIFNSIGARPTAPTQADNAKWPDQIMAFIQEHRKERETLGPRSEAIEHLADRLRSATAFPTPKAAVYGGGLLGYVWMDDPEADTVHAPSRDIQEIADEFGITPRALQIELDSRGLLNGHSHPETLEDGRTFRFWAISTTLAEPATFEAEPERE